MLASCNPGEGASAGGAPPPAPPAPTPPTSPPSAKKQKQQQPPKSPAVAAASPGRAQPHHRYVGPQCPACGARQLTDEELEAVRKPGRRSTRDSTDPRNRPENLVTKDFLEQHITVSGMSLRDIGAFHGYTISTLSRRAKQAKIQVGPRARAASEKPEGGKPAGGAAAAPPPPAAPKPALSASATPQRRKQQQPQPSEPAAAAPRAKQQPVAAAAANGAAGGGGHDKLPAKRQRKAAPKPQQQQQQGAAGGLLPALGPADAAAAVAAAAAGMGPLLPLPPEALSQAPAVPMPLWQPAPLEQLEMWQHVQAAAAQQAAAAVQAAAAGGAGVPMVGVELWEPSSQQSQQSQQAGHGSPFRKPPAGPAGAGSPVSAKKHRPPRQRKAAGHSPAPKPKASPVVRRQAQQAAFMDEGSDEDDHEAIAGLVSLRHLSVEPGASAGVAPPPAAAPAVQPAAAEAAEAAEAVAGMEAAAPAAAGGAGETAAAAVVKEAEEDEPAGGGGDAVASVEVLPGVKQEGEAHPQGSAVQQQQQAAQRPEQQAPAGERAANGGAGGAAAEQQQQHGAAQAALEAAGFDELPATQAGSSPSHPPQRQPAAEPEQQAASQGPQSPVRASQAAQAGGTPQKTTAGSGAAANGADVSPGMERVRAHALQHVLQQAVACFESAELGNADSMLRPLKRLALAGQGGPTLQDVVRRWPSYPLQQQQDLFSTAVLAASQARWEALEGDLKLALELGGS